MSVQRIIFTEVQYDLLNYSSEELMTAGRKVIAVELAVCEAKLAIAQELAKRADYLDTVLINLTQVPALGK